MSAALERQSPTAGRAESRVVELDRTDRRSRQQHYKVYQHSFERQSPSYRQLALSSRLSAVPSFAFQSCETYSSQSRLNSIRTDPIHCNQVKPKQGVCVCVGGLVDRCESVVEDLDVGAAGRQVRAARRFQPTSERERERRVGSVFSQFLEFFTFD